MLVAEKGLLYDDGGKIAASGMLDKNLLQQLNSLEYYQQPFPKSLANNFGTDTVYPMIKNAGLSLEDALCTYTEHICVQIVNAITNHQSPTTNHKLLITGGGAFNTFLIKRLSTLLEENNIEAVVPENKLVQYKEAMIMALIGVLRWREETNVLASVTGATQSSVGGALWLG